MTVFGSGWPGLGGEECRLARETGSELAKAGFRVCNGGYGGTMEAVAQGVAEAGGHTIGVVTKSFGQITPNRWVQEVVVVDTMIDRLLKLVTLGDAYVVLRGGTGTLLELAAVWEFMNKGVLSSKPIVVIGEFWEALLGILNDELLHEGRVEGAKLVSVVSTPTDCATLIRRRLLPTHG